MYVTWFRSGRDGYGTRTLCKGRGKNRSIRDGAMRSAIVCINYPVQYYTSTTPLGSANTAGVSTKGVNTSNLDCYEEAAAFDLEGGCGITY